MTSSIPFSSLAECNSMHDGQTTLACRDEERPDAIMDEFCGADFGKYMYTM